MIKARNGRRAPGDRSAPQLARNGYETQPVFAAATESRSVAQELQRYLESLIGSVRMEVLPQDGRIVLARMRAIRPKLAFVSLEMRQMDGLTLLRALPPAQASRVVLLAPDTLEGFRAAWDCLALGARDFMVTRGDPPQRIKGSVGQRIRQLAELLTPSDPSVEADPAAGCRSRAKAIPGPLSTTSSLPADAPWVVLGGTRHLARISAWIGTLRPDAPVVLRVPEGPRLVRVAKEGLGRVVPWPVRILDAGDRLVCGHVHLFPDTEAIQVEARSGHAVAQLRSTADHPGSWASFRDLVEALRASTAPLRVVVPEEEDPDLEAYLTCDGSGIHSVYRLGLEAVDRMEHGAGLGIPAGALALRPLVR